MFQRLLFLAFAVSALSTTAFAQEKEEEAIKDVIIKAYLEGAHVNQDAKAMKEGFHPNFIMFVNQKDNVSQVTIDSWAARAEEGKKKNPNRPKPDISYDFPVISIAQETAVARIEVRRNGEHIFTDFMSLYKIEGKWKIVGKVFQSYR